jgi:hypothetical protein
VNVGHDGRRPRRWRSRVVERLVLSPVVVRRRRAPLATKCAGEWIALVGRDRRHATEYARAPPQEHLLY